MDPQTIIFIVLLVVLIVALLVVPMFTNKKRAKETENLHNSLKPGDLIKTVGGIVGTIKEIRQVSPVDKEMVIETGEEGSKCTMVFDIQALYQIMSRSNTVVAPEEPAPEETVPEEKPVEAVAETAPAEEKAPVQEAPVTEEKQEAEVTAEEAPAEQKPEEPAEVTEAEQKAPPKKKPISRPKSAKK